MLEKLTQYPNKGSIKFKIFFLTYRIIVYFFFLLSSGALYFRKKKIFDHGILFKAILSITLHIDCFSSSWIFLVLLYVCSFSSTWQPNRESRSNKIKILSKFNWNFLWCDWSYIGYISDAQFHLSLIGTIFEDYIVSSRFYLYKAFLASFRQDFTQINSALANKIIVFFIFFKYFKKVIVKWTPQKRGSTFSMHCLLIRSVQQLVD